MRRITWMKWVDKVEASLLGKLCFGINCMWIDIKRCCTIVGKNQKNVIICEITVKILLKWLQYMIISIGTTLIVLVHYLPLGLHRIESWMEWAIATGIKIIGAVRKRQPCAYSHLHWLWLGMPPYTPTSWEFSLAHSRCKKHNILYADRDI